MKPRRICMVAYTLYDFDNRVRRAAEVLAGEGHLVTAFTVSLSDKARRYELKGVTVQELSVKKYQGNSTLMYLMSYSLFGLIAFAKLTKRCMRGEIDVVHVHNLPDFLVFCALCPRIMGKFIILDIHDSVPETFCAKFDRSPRWLFWLLCFEERICCAFAHAVVAVNEPQRNVLVARKIPREKIWVVMNAPDPRLFASRRCGSRESDMKGCLRLGYHGTIAHRLGVDLLVQAVHRLRERIPRVELHLWGGGEQLDDVLALADELGLHDHVMFNGTVTMDELETVLRRVDVGVIANRSNTATDLMLPVKLMEYVALGIPVVAPRLPAIVHYFHEDMISYFEPENVDTLVDRLLQLYDNPDMCSAQVVQARTFLNAHGWETERKSLVSLYECRK